jgi:arylsulfatase
MRIGRTFAIASLLAAIAAPAWSQAQQKPNILVIWGDDIGFWNISAYNRGMMGYRTPNIDRIAREGAIFTDYYGQQSCTAGRAAFITGQSPIRTGLTKVGLPGAAIGLRKEDANGRFATRSWRCRHRPWWRDSSRRSRSSRRARRRPASASTR